MLRTRNLLARIDLTLCVSVAVDTRGIVEEHSVTSRANKRPGIFISCGRRQQGPRRAPQRLATCSARRSTRVCSWTSRRSQPGAEFANALDEAVTQCRVFYTLIGPMWVDIRYDDGDRRLLDPKDYVRREIAMALRAPDEVRVVPVLVVASCRTRTNFPKTCRRSSGDKGSPCTTAAGGRTSTTSSRRRSVLDPGCNDRSQSER